MSSCNECAHFKTCKYKNKVMKMQRDIYPLQYECRLFEDYEPEFIKEMRKEILERDRHG